MSGNEGIQSEKVQVFAEELRRKFKLPVHLFDERLTSVEANRLLRETEMSIRRRAEVVDQMAAVLILQSFLEFRKSSQQPESEQLVRAAHRHGASSKLRYSMRTLTQTRRAVLVLAFAAWFAWAALLPVNRADDVRAAASGLEHPPHRPRIAAQGVIRSSTAFLMLHTPKGLKTLKAGEYKFDQPASALKCGAA